MNEPVEFEGSIAPLQSAITIHADGGSRFKIDIPESEMPAIMRLVLLRGKRLKFRVEEADPDAEKENQNSLAKWHRS